MRFFISLIFCIVFFSCNNHADTPDVSNININLKTYRFEKDLFKLDSNYIANQLDPLIAAYPSFGENFMNTILNADPRWGFDTTLIYIKGFLSTYKPIYDTAGIIFKDFTAYENEIKNGLRFVKYYFPKYNTPQQIITYIGPLDGYGDILTEEAFVIGLQQHLGKNASYYQSEWLYETYPKYITDRFEPENISVNCMNNIVLDLYPEIKTESSLALQMIEKGKRLYLLQHFLPEKKEHLLIGYTEKQLKDCYEHEAAIWNLFIQNGLLQNTDYNIIKNYIGESPKTQELGDASPGNIGSFIGWQIVKKFMNKNSNTSLVDLMKMNSETILEKAKYKP